MHPTRRFQMSSYCANAGQEACGWSQTIVQNSGLKDGVFKVFLGDFLVISPNISTWSLATKGTIEYYSIYRFLIGIALLGSAASFDFISWMIQRLLIRVKSIKEMTIWFQDFLQVEVPSCEQSHIPL